MSEIRLAISIAAHERVDVLYGQCLNILKFCDAPIIVIHINQAFHAAISNDRSSASTLALIACLPGVFINPENLYTKWAHMFHAHVSNARYLEKLNISYSHFVFSSSGDLFFRRGAEAHVAPFDAGIYTQGNQITRSNGGSDDWFQAIVADDVFWGMLAACGARYGINSSHEGSFYRRALLLRGLDLVERFVKDWHYDDRYPKEEYFLPSIVPALYPSAKITIPLAKILGMREDPASQDWVNGRLLVHHALQELGANASGNGAFSHWFRHPELCQPLQGEGAAKHFILGRLVRSATDPLRQLVIRLSDPLPSWERAEILERLDCFDVISLDLPGRRHLLHSVTMSEAASKLISSRAADPLLNDLAVERSASIRDLDACPTSSLPYSRLWEGEASVASVSLIHSYAFRLAKPGGKLLTEVKEGALSITLEQAGQASERNPLWAHGRVVLVWACRGLEPRVHRALRFIIEGDQRLTGGLSIKLEYRGASGRRWLETGGIVRSGLAGRQNEFFLLMRSEDLCRAGAELGAGFFVIHMILPTRDGTIRIKECTALRGTA